MESLGIIEVLHNGSAVWIESIKDNSTAEVRYLNTDKMAEVPIGSLVEGHTTKS